MNEEHDPMSGVGLEEKWGLPAIEPFEEISLEEEFNVITAAGFEDRAIAVFEELQERGQISTIETGVGIEYKPFDPNNDKQGLINGMQSIGVQDEDLMMVTFDRFNPDTFEPRLEEILEDNASEKVLLDISGMSKLLITIILNILAEHDSEVVIFYAEAEIYHPTQSGFEDEQEDEPQKTPAFLTHGVYEIVTTRELSSLAKTGQPIVAIAFPTFNHQELMALVSELSPHRFVSIEGIPRLAEDAWRQNAIRWLNRELRSNIDVEAMETSTFDYRETFHLLRDLYDDYSDAYRLVMAPTGSKLQTVGASLFRRLHKDIQIVYPVTKEFSDTYTEGWKQTWGIELGNIDETVDKYETESDETIARLREKIAEMNEQRRTTK